MEKLDQDCNAEHKQKGKAGTVVKKLGRLRGCSELLGAISQW